MPSPASIASRSVLAATALLLLAAPTDCQSWGDVVIPPFDFEPPVTVGAVWGVENAPLRGFDDEGLPLSYRIPAGRSPWGPVPVAAAFDDSGVHSIAVRTWSEHQCCGPAGCGPVVRTPERFFRESDETPLRPRRGETVPGGRWVALDYAPPDCPSGQQLEKYSYRWSIGDAVDWSANRTTWGGTHEIVYRAH